MKRIFLLIIINFTHVFFAADKDAAYQGYLIRCHVANERAKIAQEKLVEYIPMVLAQIIKQYLELKCITYDQWLKNGQDLIKAALDGNLEKVKELLESEEVDVNARGNYHNTALIAAAYSGRKEIVKMLINAKADVNAFDYVAWTALMKAAYNKHKETVELLINSNANVNAKNKDYNTALMIAARNKDNEIVAMLKKAGAK